ncbi:PAS and ANTAR domain-containing protein [Mycobacterium colombiense]|uniref:PAS and ANTAR domain-containing protein n=1 Tax=Mycobacterium colombiense TaxID=339268 RepID=UPI00200A017B|nr:PAS and ANTAR domain-containing protein [Mycobacterium colombiense]MCK8647276.1 PAS and ANTAR domain-containing protein [Mycobacterium colombiense]
MTAEPKLPTTLSTENNADGETPRRAGTFSFFFDDQRWEWSDPVQRMHGYVPGSVTPTTELVLFHKHPDDRDRVAAVVNDTLTSHQPFSTRHRIVDTAGAVHHVIVVGDQLRDGTGAVIGTHGFYIDVTPPSSSAPQEAITAEVAEIAERRAAIEQTKGMLMVIYDIDENAAFNLLKWLSQESNTKLRVVAQRLGDRLRATAHSAFTPRSICDQILIDSREQPDATKQADR